ncbi:hypothetical protein [Agreia sp.]|uniref:hypothetical protein n=1 Tax=Agreia sp. TaxID=1872416 RepID=UPI0035BC5811
MRPTFLTRAALGFGVVALSTGLAACSPTAGPTSSTPDSRRTIPAPSATATSSPEDTPVPIPASDSAARETVYADGEYAATGWYGGLPSHHDVTLTIAVDVVTGVEITTPAEDETSLGYQQRFAEALPAAVVGRSIDEIAVDRLAGSTGCSQGFMDALAQIKEQATA